jgi:hypothetical protein
VPGINDAGSPHDRDRIRLDHEHDEIGTSQDRRRIRPWASVDHNSACMGKNVNNIRCGLGSNTFRPENSGYDPKPPDPLDLLDNFRAAVENGINAIGEIRTRRQPQSNGDRGTLEIGVH